MKRQSQGECGLLFEVFSVVLTSLYNTRRPTCNNTITLTVIYYSLLDYGNGFDLKGSKCVCGPREEEEYE